MDDIDLERKTELHKRTMKAYIKSKGTEFKERQTQKDKHSKRHDERHSEVSTHRHKERQIFRDI